MTNKTKKTLAWVLALAVLALAGAVVAYMLLRGGSAAPEQADPYDTKYSRMHDPAYLKQLDELREEQRQVAVKLSAAKAALDAAKEKGEDSPEYKSAQQALEAAKSDFLKNRAKAQLTVRERIMQENDAIKAKQEASKQKGE